MGFDEWFSREGALMLDGGCSSQAVAAAAWHVATHDGFVAGFICGGGGSEEGKQQAQQFLDCVKAAETPN